MPRSTIKPALIAHGGAGAQGPANERSERRRGMIEAVRRGADILRSGGSAIDAVIATVIALEDHPLFNAGTGSLLTTAGTVEMDASVMIAAPADALGEAPDTHDRRGEPPDYRVSAGAIAGVGRVRNPIMLARAVMEQTPHVLMAGQGAERFARSAGILMCRNEDLITPRARERWKLRTERRRVEPIAANPGHGTVGAVAIDSRGMLAAATSTGGVPGKLPGRVGDSAIVGAGTFADPQGAASATGHGEAIIVAGLCREAVLALEGHSPSAIAKHAVMEMLAGSGADGGIIIIDRRGRIGFAHNAAAMQIATYETDSGIKHLWPDPAGKSKRQ